MQELYKKSVLHYFLINARGLIQQSCAVHLMMLFLGFVKRLWFGSIFAAFFSRRGYLSRNWDSSLSFSLLTALLGAIPRLLRKIGDLSRPLWEGSIIIRATWYCGESSYIFLSWFILLLLVTPQEHWNNMYSLTVLSAILFMFFISAMRNRAAAIELKSVGIYSVAFGFFVMLSVVLSHDTASSVRFFIFHIICAMAVLLVVSTVRTPRELLRLLNFALLGVFIASLYAISQSLRGIEVNRSLVDLSVNINMPGRAFSFFENPNSFSVILVLFLPPALALFCYSKGLKRIFYLSVFLAAAAALITTYSRGAWLGFAFSIFIFTLIMRPSLLPVMLLAGIFIFPILPDTIYNRIMTMFNPRDTSISSRKPVYDAAFKLIRRYPLTGVGLGSETVKDAMLELELYSYRAPFIHAHNIYLQLICETGIFGALSFLGAMLTGIKNGLLSITSKKGSRELRAVIAGSIAGISGVLLFSLADYPWSYPRVMLIFWFAFSILISAIKLSNNE